MGTTITTESLVGDLNTNPVIVTQLGQYLRWLCPDDCMVVNITFTKNVDNGFYYLLVDASAQIFQLDQEQIADIEEIVNEEIHGRLGVVEEGGITPDLSRFPVVIFKFVKDEADNEWRLLVRSVYAVCSALIGFAFFMHSTA